MTEDASALPNCTSAPALKLVPDIVTRVPPAAGPLLGEKPAILGGGSPMMFSDNPVVEEVAFASSTLAVNEKAPTALGVPAIVPLIGLSWSPAGSPPPAVLHEYGGTPPAALKAEEYFVPTEPTGRLLVVISSGATNVKAFGEVTVSPSES